MTRPPKSPAPSRTALGRAAEGLVAAWLEARGKVVVRRNLRLGRDEIDLVVLDGETTVFVEVRSGRRESMVHPAESLTPAKRARLRRAALFHAAGLRAVDLRIDVAIVVDGEVDYYENAVDFEGR